MITTRDTSFLINLEHSISSDFKIVVDNIKLRKSSVTGLIGKNGSGKTSLLRSMSLKEFLLGGTNYFSFVEKIPQELAHLSCDNYLKFAATASKIDSYNSSLFEAIGFKEIKNKKIASLSTGQLRRFLNLLAFLKFDKIILLDEPFNGLDREYENRLLNYLRETKMTILIAAHQTRILKDICDSFLTVDNGILKVVNEKDYGKIANEKNYILKFNVRIQNDHRLRYLGKNNDFYEYTFCKESFSNSEKGEILEVLEVIKSHPEFFEEMKKSEGEISYRSLN